MKDTLRIPSCPRCNIHLIIGIVPGSFINKLKAEFGWRIARVDAGVSKNEADAIIAPCGVRKCPRCGIQLKF